MIRTSLVIIRRDGVLEEGSFEVGSSAIVDEVDESSAMVGWMIRSKLLVFLTLK